MKIETAVEAPPVKPKRLNSLWKQLPQLADDQPNSFANRRQAKYAGS